MKSLFIFASLLLMATSQNQSPLGTNQIAFSARKFLWSVKGSFEKFESNCTFNPQNLQASNISGKAQIASINTGNETRDGHLQGEDWFDAEKHSTISVFSNSFKKISAITYKGNFSITIKGKTLKKDIEFTLDDAINPKNIQANFSLKLSDFNIGSGKGVDWVVGDKVDVEVSLINKAN